jgi:hypothetical protein
MLVCESTQFREASGDAAKAIRDPKRVPPE